MEIWEIVLSIACPVGFYLLIHSLAKRKSDKAERKLIEENKIIERKGDFFKNAEIFRVETADKLDLVDSVLKLPYNTMPGVKVSYNREKQVFIFKTYGWEAVLKLVSYNHGSADYRFTFTHLEHTYGAIPNGQYMNVLLTAIEKMFISIDSNTKVRTEAVEYKTKSR